MFNIIRKVLLGVLCFIYSAISFAEGNSTLQVGIDLTYAPYAYLERGR